MAEPLDVAARLAEGHPAVDNVGDYVWACHLLGYQNPDLTLHPAQVRDWYGSEDGLDLRALESDRAALDAAATATDSAQRLQEQQVGALAGAWQGRGGDASREFLLRHGEASAEAASAVRRAVDAFTALRDELWHAVDEKVAAAVAIDDRRQAQRGEWLAAAKTVATAAGDRSTASELIDKEVKPFVDNDVRSDWLTAMQKAMAAVSAAFDAATGSLTGEPVQPFELPGDLGASPPMPSPLNGMPPAEVPGTVPAAWPSAAPAASPLSGPMASPAPPAMAPPTYTAAQAPPAMPMAAVPAEAPTSAIPTAASTPSMPSLGDLGGGLPGAGGGLPGLGSQIADAIGGLLDATDGLSPDPPEVTDEAAEDDQQQTSDDDPASNDPASDEEEGEEKDDEEKDDEEKDDESGTETAGLADEGSDDADEDVADDGGEDGAEPVDACTETVDETPPPDPVSTAPPEPMPPPEPIVAPPPDPEPVAAQTPCEIAADELPQAGP